MTTRSVILTSLLMAAATLRSEPVNENLTVLIDSSTIEKRVQEIGKQIENDYRGKDLVVVMVMKGSICLAADLIRSIQIPLNLEAVRCSSYGSLGMQRGQLQVDGLDKLNVQNRDVLIVDDIFDSGTTMTLLVEQIRQKNPRSVKSCVLLLKNGIERTTQLLPDYTLFEIENQFVVGYGLDYKEKYRGLPGVYVLANE